MIGKIRSFTAGNNFSNALKVTLASVLPVLIGTQFDRFDVGLNMAIGALLTYPSDIARNFRHKVKGVISAVLLVGLGNFLMNLLIPFPILVSVFLALVVFSLAMISVYGRRASMVSFSGLMAVSLAFAHPHTGWENVRYSGLMIAGGLFYLGISLLFDLLMPHRYVHSQIAECLKLTAKYMKLRGDLWNPIADREKIIKNQLELQVELNAIHENLREILIRTRSASGISDQNRRMLLVFVSCVEILELALSTSFDHNKLHKKFEHFPKALSTYQNLAYNLASTLKKISKSITQNTQYVSKKSLIPDLEALDETIREYENLWGNEAYEGALMLTNMMHYAEKQIEKIKVIERVFSNKTELKELKERDRTLEKLVVPDYFSFRILRENLTFSSNFFRHSLRLTVTVMLGYMLGKLLLFENAYWIVMTIVVIMRPGYGLTKTRSFGRTIGTIAGGVVGFAFLKLTGNEAIIGTAAVVCMLLGYAFSQINYTVGATFATVYVILLYGLLVPGSSKVIEFRIIDTLVGATLAFIANHFLWPSWEFLNLRTYIKKSIAANRDYLREIAAYYNQKGETPQSYRTSRRIAFVEIGNLMSSFQRMTQEPKSKQRQLQQLYKIVELNHSLLSASASLGTYVQTHSTTKASEAFNVVADTIVRNLEAAIQVIDSNDSEVAAVPRESLEMRFTELKNLRAKEIEDSRQPDYRSKMLEAQLVLEQLVWLISLSEGILKATKKLEAS